eukprot:scaffold38181_cov21-Attheya_sp.AAC.1
MKHILIAAAIWLIAPWNSILAQNVVGHEGPVNPQGNLVVVNAVDADPTVGAHAHAPSSLVSSTSFVRKMTTATGDVHAIGYDGTGSTCLIQASQTFMVGWKFNITSLSGIYVTAMSWYDEGLNGLEVEHDVAIWDPNGNIIADTRVTIPEGTDATLDDVWRTVAISPPVLLTQGDGYIVAGLAPHNKDCYSFHFDSLANLPMQEVMSGINYVLAMFKTTNFFNLPTEEASNPNFFGFFAASFKACLPEECPSMSPSGEPSTSMSPSGEPSTSPSDKPSTSTSPSDKPSTSTSPSGEPTTPPSTSPSDKPS